MILPEPLEIINQRLIDYYGKFETGEANWRVVFSDDQIEKRWVQHTKEGFELPNPIVEERPKYRQWIHHKYVLERCLPTPEISDLIGKTSFEPVWTFEDKEGNPLPPIWLAIEFVIKAVEKQAAQSVGAKYKDDPINENSLEAQIARAELLEDYLFGGESTIADRLHHKEGVTVGDVPEPSTIK